MLLIHLYRFKELFSIKKKLDKRKIFAGLGIVLILGFPYKHKYKSNYVILDDKEGAFASYSDGLIYIGDRNYINSLNNINENDILIIDERGKEDPDMVICDSCRIKDKDIRNDILEVICCYEEIHPSNWDRTIESMRFEWFCHNMAYYVNYKVKDSSEVDLNNKDEEKYNKKILRRIFRI
ncbi:MAG: hypothetical protein IK137_00535 [Bacilli bacterium]|nr:hypothetical protein [Bacilli bacterium]